MNAAEEREHIKLAYPAEFNDGARRGFIGNHLYPPGFVDWPLERRDAFFAGFVLGYFDRLRLEREIDG